MGYQSEADRIPVLIGVGEISDRPAVETEGLESLGLMLEALKAAEADVGAPILGKLDWLGVEDQISFPNPDLHHDLAHKLAKLPRYVLRTFEASGDGPIQLINDAANLIGRGEIRLAAAVGAEAMRTAGKRAAAAAAAAPPGTQKADRLAESAAAGATPIARQHGLLTPTEVYPLYENATRAAWGQTLTEAQWETGLIWSGFSKVAAENPGAWLKKPVGPDVIVEPTADNRWISFPYTKLMVANSAVNQGCAVIIASLAMARELGVPEDRLVYLGQGASAHEPDDFLKRDTYTHSASLNATVTSALAFNKLKPADIDHVELYSCFPCVPKMARRVLDWPLDKPASVYGGLTFGGGPIGNCMMHATAAMVRKLRAGGTNGLIVANGGYATHSHSMVFTRTPQPAGTFPQNYNVQPIADAQRGPVPELLADYEGDGTVETYTIPFDRHGQPRSATIVARTPAGARFLAHVPGEDQATIAYLMADDSHPVGSRGHATRRDDGQTIWTRA